MGLFGKSKTEHQGEDGQLQDPSKRASARKIVGAVITAYVGGGAPHAETAESRRIRSATGRFKEGRAAQGQMDHFGIPDFQRQAYVPGVSETFVNGIDAFQGLAQARLGDVAYVLGGLIVGNTAGSLNEARRSDILRHIAESAGDEESRRYHENILEEFDASYDAWRLYNGMPQVRGTFGISRWRPEGGEDDIFYYKLKDPGMIPLPHSVSEEVRSSGVEPDLSSGNLLVPAILRMLEHRPEDSPNSYGFNKDFVDDLQGNPNRAYHADITMGTFVVSKGRDAHGFYVSYYDLLDYGAVFADARGKPFEIYDRIYYDPNNPPTFKRSQPQV